MWNVGEAASRHRLAGSDRDHCRGVNLTGRGGLDDALDGETNVNRRRSGVTLHSSYRRKA